MNHKVHESLSELLVPVDSLMPLPGNPRVGNVDAIMASYEEFGQVKPIVVRPSDDGQLIVIAGNHQLEAVKRLGWSHIAAVQMNVNDQRALAYAMADNRTMELGHTDQDLLSDILAQISDDYVDLLENLEYDAFEIAALEVHAARPESVLDDGYVPPVITRATEAIESIASLADKVAVSFDDGEQKIAAKPDVDAKTAITSGSTAVGAAGTNKAVVQYTLVFDDADQQRKWYSFIRWLRNSPVYEGDTTAERLMMFIDAHSSLE